MGSCYAGIVADLYGVENIGRSREECRSLMNALRDDRPGLQSRLIKLLETVRGQAEVDAAEVAAIGYCFGGLCALDLARTGADLRGVASFHGLFTPPGNLDGTPIRAKVIVFHGWDDPMVLSDVERWAANERSRRDGGSRFEGRCTVSPTRPPISPRRPRSSVAEARHGGRSPRPEEGSAKRWRRGKNSESQAAELIGARGDRAAQPALP